MNNVKFSLRYGWIEPIVQKFRFCYSRGYDETLHERKYFLHELLELGNVLLADLQVPLSYCIKTSGEEYGE